MSVYIPVMQGIVVLCLLGNVSIITMKKEIHGKYSLEEYTSYFPFTHLTTRISLHFVVALVTTFRMGRYDYGLKKVYNWRGTFIIPICVYLILVCLCYLT